MKSLNELGYYLRGNLPNAEGKSTFAIVDLRTDQVMAETEEPTTAEEIHAMAREFANLYLDREKLAAEERQDHENRNNLLWAGDPDQERDR